MKETDQHTNLLERESVERIDKLILWTGSMIGFAVIILILLIMITSS